MDTKELEQLVNGMSEKEIDDFISGASPEELDQIEKLLTSTTESKDEGKGKEKEEEQSTEEASEALLYEIAEEIAKGLISGEIKPSDLQEVLGEDYDKVSNLLEPSLLEERESESKVASDRKEKNTLAQTLAGLKI